MFAQARMTVNILNEHWWSLHPKQVKTARYDVSRSGIESSRDRGSLGFHFESSLGNYQAIRKMRAAFAHN